MTNNINGFGKIFMVGKNSHGQLGVEILGKDIIYDQENYTNLPMLLEGFDNISYIACGPSHSGFINNGHIYMMGNGSFGKLGNGTTEDKRLPTLVAHEQYENFVQLVCANEHSMALGTDGLIYSWGSTTYGRLGHGEYHQLKVKVTPKTIDFFKTIPNIKIKQIAACGAASAALTECGKLYTWGINKNGQLGQGDYKDLFIPKLVSYFDGLAPIVKVSVGNRQMGCVDSRGSLFMWGLNESYQLGDGTSFTKSLPTQIKVKEIVFRDVCCGGDFGTAISNEADNNSLYIWGGFVREYASSRPKKLTDNVLSVSCSSDCGKHLMLRKFDGSTHSVGWSRYGQTTFEMDTLLVEQSHMDMIIGETSQVACGAYHSCMLFTNQKAFTLQLIKLGYHTQAANQYKAYSNSIEYTNYNKDTILHVLAKQRLPYLSVYPFFSKIINTPNKDEIPAFFYHADIINWPLESKKSQFSDLSYQIPSTLDTWIHYYAKNNMIDDLMIGLPKSDVKIRNKAGQRALDLLPQEKSYEMKQKFKIYDIAIVATHTPSNVRLINVIINSLNENHITAVMVTDQTPRFNTLGYIHCITKDALSSPWYKDVLLNFSSKNPMISIWGEKTNIEDPILESCIYRSQLVDFSSQDLYEKSLSVLLQGVHNIINFIPKSDDDSEETEDIKTDVDYINSISEKGSIFISFDPSKVTKFQPLFDFIKDQGIEIIPREKGVLQSWLVVVILFQPDLSPLMRNEISLAENRNKLVIPIYYENLIRFDKGLTYSFANAPRIFFNQEGFNQLLLSIKLQFAFLNETTKFLSLKK